MDKELEKRRSWPWKKKNGMNGTEGGTLLTPVNPVKLYDEQEVAKILEEQARSGDEQAHNAWREAEENFTEKERSFNIRIATADEKLSSALEEISIKDKLVLQHLKVAEEAAAGWEKADIEAAAFKLKHDAVIKQRDAAIQQRLATEDRVKHLDGALKEVMKQLRSGREEQEQRIHEIIVNKTREYDKLRAELESKMTEASHILAQTSSKLVESRAENKALTQALQERSSKMTGLKEEKVRVEADMKILQVRLEGLEKENIDLKHRLHSVTKELQARSLELECGRRVPDLAIRQNADNLKKIAKLEDECNRLRNVVRKKLPSQAAMVRKQEVDVLLRKEPGEIIKQRRRSKSINGVPQPQQETAQENEHHPKGSAVVTPREIDVLAGQVVKLNEETQVLKEALAKRNDELQIARIMCARTASRLSSVENELEALKSTPRSKLSVDATSDIWDTASSAVLESSQKHLALKRDSSNFELMDDFIEMERLANSQSRSQSVVGSEHATEIASTTGFDTSHYQHQITVLEDAMSVKNRELEAANYMCQDLSTKLAAAEDQLSSLQNQNTAHEQLVINLQNRLDQVLEIQKQAAKDSEAKASAVQSKLVMAIRKVVHLTEALAQATGSECDRLTSSQADTSTPTGLIAISMRWQDLQLDSSIGSLVRAANICLEGEQNTAEFILELTSTLDCIMAIFITTFENVRKERDSALSDRLATSATLESANVKLSHLKEEMHTIETGRAALEINMQAEMSRCSGFESDILQLKTEKARMERNILDMEDDLLALENVRKERDSAVNDRLATSAMLDSANVQLSQLKEELRTIQEEQAALDIHMQLEQSQFSGLEAEISQLRTEKATMEDNMLDMVDRFSEANERVEALRVQLKEAEALIAELRIQQASHYTEKKEDELIEEELLELASPNPGFGFSRRAADAEINQLHDKVAALEVDLHGERRRHHEVVEKLEDLQQQIHRGVGRSEHISGSLNSKEAERSQIVTTDEDPATVARKEKEIAAAALAECQRTILVLGKQLKVLGSQEPTELVSISTDSADSIQKMTQTMEFLRSQSEPTTIPVQSSPTVAGTNLSWAGTSPRPTKPIIPGLFYRQNINLGTKNEILTPYNGEMTDGPLPMPSNFPVTEKPIGPAPGSPATALRSVRTIRSKAVNRFSELAINVNENRDENRELRSVSSYMRFYPRSQSETSVSSGYSN